jgi:hypothetical protein
MKRPNGKRGLGVSFATIVVFFLACGSPEQPAAPTVPSSSETTQSGSSDPLEGTWSTLPMTKAEHIKAARAAGCSEGTIGSFDEWPVNAVHTLTFEDGMFVESAADEGAPPEVGSSGAYTRPDATTLVLPESPPFDDLVFDVELDGDELTLRFRDWACDHPYDGPYQAFIFQGAPFIRQP